MGLLDSLKSQQLKSTFEAATKFATEAGKVVKSAADVTNSFVAEQQEKIAVHKAERQEIARLKKEEETARKKREEEIASGYYIEDGQLIVSSLNGMKLWLQDLGKDATPAIMQVLNTQLQVLKYVESPSMVGMMFDNMILCLSKSLKQTTDAVQKENIRDAFASMIQSYFFMIETNLRCAEKKDSEETKQMLQQSGELLSDAVKNVAQVALAANGVGDPHAAVMNVFETMEAKSGYIKNVFSWLANKKVLKEKQEQFYKTLEMLFDTMDTHSDLLGASILTHGMLRKYRHELVDRYRQMKIQQYIDRGFKIDPRKISELSEGLTSAATALVSPVKKTGAITGAMQSLNAVGGLITDFVNNSTKNGLDIVAYCDLQDALEKEYERLKTEYDQAEHKLDTLRDSQKEVGFLKFAEKKEWQEKIDRQKTESDAIYARLQIIREQSATMRQTFPDSFAMRSDIESYNANLKRIEQKYCVQINMRQS